MLQKLYSIEVLQGSYVYKFGIINELKVANVFNNPVRIIGFV